MKPRKLLLTGASGFIGSAFLSHALNAGFDVRVLTRKPEIWKTHPRLQVVEGDLSQPSDWSYALNGVEVVVHAAAELRDPALMNVVNVSGALRLFDAASRAGVKRWVQLSSVGAYGPVLTGVVTEDWPENPDGPYEVSKSNFDRMLREMNHAHEIEFCIVRPSNVYGVSMRNNSIQQMLDVMERNLFAFIGPEGATANYVHVQDVVQALDLCVSHPKAVNQTFIVSDWATMEEMVGALAAGAGLTSPSRRVPLPFAMLVARMMRWWPGWPLTQGRVRAMSLRSRYDTAKIEKELGWKLTMPIKEGMRELAQRLNR